VIVNGELWLHQFIGNHALSGALAAVLCTPLTAPLDLLRIRAQTGNAVQGLLALRAGTSFGWGISALREGLGGAIFFSTLHYVKTETESPLLAGAAAGLLSTLTHPFDVVKTRVQHGMPLVSAIRQGGFGGGLPITLCKAVSMNAAQFVIYYHMLENQ
jgi:hypothetical protein